MMGLVGISEHKNVDIELLEYAAENSPCLVIDCSNTANPHLLYPKYGFKELSSVYVIPVELIYTFRDVVKNLDLTCKESGLSKVVITRFGRLINYQNEDEIKNLYLESWELLGKHSRLIEIRLAIPDGQMELAKKYCDLIL